MPDSARNVSEARLQWFEEQPTERLQELRVQLGQADVDVVTAILDRRAGGAGGTLVLQKAEKKDHAQITPNSPLLLVLPWRVLVSKNEKKPRKGEKRKAREQRFRNLVDAARAEAAKQVQDPKPRFAGDVLLRVTVYRPDARRRDPLNLSEAICDALQGVAYVDDVQILESSWRRGGVDRLQPRAVIVVEAA